MKLTNQQVDALTNKIYDEISADMLSQYNSDMAIIKKRFEKTKEYAAMILINEHLPIKKKLSPKRIFFKLTQRLSQGKLKRDNRFV